MTEELLAKIPDDLLEFRPEDPSGRFQFSIAEIFAHVADARTMFATTYLADVPMDDQEGLYMMSPPDEDGAWKPNVEDFGRPALERALAEGWGRLAPALEMPESEAFAATPGGLRMHDAAASRRDAGEEPQPWDERVLSWGPATLIRVLATCASHEAGHRGALVSLARRHGVAVT